MRKILDKSADVGRNYGKSDKKCKLGGEGGRAGRDTGVVRGVSFASGFNELTPVGWFGFT